MTDVLKIALERRSKLQEEVAKLDEFIRTAETLIRSGGVPVAGMSAPAAAQAAAPAQAQAAAEPEESPTRAAMRRATEAETADATDVPRPSIIRRSSVASNG